MNSSPTLPRSITTKLIIGCLALLYSYASAANSAEVIGRSPDNTSGRMLGGWSTFLLGGAAAGPFGAIAGGLIGIWIGDQAQASSGLSGNTYQIRKEDGSVESIRSPKTSFLIGDQVEIRGIRLQAINRSH